MESELWSHMRLALWHYSLHNAYILVWFVLHHQRRVSLLNMFWVTEKRHTFTKLLCGVAEGSCEDENGKRSYIWEIEEDA